MADKKESNEDILRAIMEKGGARAKGQVAEQLAAKVVAEPAPAPAKKRRKSLKGVVGSISNTKYYYGPGGTIVDKDGVQASERISAMLKQKDEMADQVKSAIMPKSLRPIEGEINKAIKQTSKLSKTQDAIYAKTPAIFGEFDKTIQNLTQQHENIVRQLIQQNQDLQDKVIEALTGQKAATRAGGAVAPKRVPKGATRAVGGSRAAAATPTKAAYQKARVTKPAAVKARHESMLKAREEKTRNMVNKGMIIGAGIGAAGGILSNMMGGGGGGQTPTAPGGGASPGATPSAVPGMVKLVTPGGREYTVAEQYASNFKGFVDELENSGYKINSIGGYANRNIAGTGTKSYHSLGVAIDINPSTNPHLFDGRLVTDMPSNVGEIAAKYGLGWGGNWRSSKDAMHFSMAAGEGGSVSIDRSGVSPLPGAPAPQTGTTPTTGAPTGGATNPGVITAPGAGTPAAAGAAGNPAVKDVAQYIVNKASSMGVDPNMALGIAAYEGLNPNTIGSATFGNKDSRGYSFGPYQLFSNSPDPTRIAPGGMAYEFMQKYGQAPSAANWQQQVDFSLELMARKGPGGLERGPWYAVRDRGGIANITKLGAQFASQQGLGAAGTQTVPQNPGMISAPGAAAPSGTAPGEPQRAEGGSVPSGDIVAIGKWLEGQGIRVSENPSFGGVGNMHRGRGHYEGRAIDVNAGTGIVEADDPVWGPRFDELAAKAKAAGYTVIWRSAGHYNHMHIEIPGGPQGGPQAAAQGTMPQAAPPPMNAPSMSPQRPVNPGIGFNQASRGMSIQQDMMDQMQNILPIIMNNTQYVNNTRTITRGQSSITRASDGFDPLATVAAVAGFAIGKGLRGLF